MDAYEYEKKVICELGVVEVKDMLPIVVTGCPSVTDIFVVAGSGINLLVTAGV